MVKPTQPKGIKPKAESKLPAEGGAVEAAPGINGIKLIIANTIITVLICLLFITSNYFIVQNSLNSSIAKIDGLSIKEDTGHEEEHVTDKPGIILDLGEFILNLNDPKARRYLKINVALELTRLDTDDEGHSSGGHGGHGSADPMEHIMAEMGHYKPAIRDAVISILSSKTAEELSSIAGKELAKEQIKEAVNSILNGHREVQRVSFGNFIIQ